MKEYQNNIHRLHLLPFVKTFLRDLVDNIEHVGLPEAVRRESAKRGLHYTIVGLTPELSGVLAHEKVVILANHPHKAEVPSIVASLPDRKDIYLISTAAFLSIHSILDQHIIPVWIQHHYRQYGLTLRKLIFSFFHRGYQLSAEEEHQRNIESTKLAVEKINRGGLLITFPARGNREGRWFSGIGHLLTQLQDTDSVFIVFVHVGHTSYFDFLRVFALYNRIAPTITVKFSKPQMLSEVYSSDPKILTEKLEDMYNTWVEER